MSYVDPLLLVDPQCYARYGYPFDESPEWRTTFESEAWYVRRDDFSTDWLPETVVDNGEELQRRKRERVACMDY